MPREKTRPKRRNKADEWAETFSQQTKKFSAFEMLGIPSKTTNPNEEPGVDPLTGQRPDGLTDGLTLGSEGRPSDRR